MSEEALLNQDESGQLSVGQKRQNSENGGPASKKANISESDTVQIKVLIPSGAVGALIGKGGETMRNLKNDTGCRVQMSKNQEVYHGTHERICLVKGKVSSTMLVMGAILEKIQEKIDSNMPSDIYDLKGMDRCKEMKFVVPNTSAGMVIGKSGASIKEIREQTTANIQVYPKAGSEEAKQSIERVITVGHEQNEILLGAVQRVLEKVVADPLHAHPTDSGAKPEVDVVEDISSTLTDFVGGCVKLESNKPGDEVILVDEPTSSFHSNLLPITATAFALSSNTPLESFECASSSTSGTAKRRRISTKEITQRISSGEFTRRPHTGSKYGVWYDKLIENGQYQNRVICKECSAVYNASNPLNMKGHIDTEHPYLIHLEEEGASLTKAMIDWATYDCRVLSIFDGSGWKKFAGEFIRIILARYESGQKDFDPSILPQSSVLRTILDERLSVIRSEKLSEPLRLMKANGCGFAIDFGGYNTPDYILVMAHYLDHEWNLKNFMMSFERYPIDGDKCCEELSNHVTGVLQSFDFLSETLSNKIYLISNNVANVRRFRNGVNCCRCMANSVAERMVVPTEITTLDPIFKKACADIFHSLTNLRSLFSSLRKVPLLKEKLSGILTLPLVEQYGLDYFKMVENFIENVSIIKEFVCDSTSVSLPKNMFYELCDSMEHFNAYLEIAAPIKELVATLENGETPSSNLIVPKFAKFYVRLKKFAQSDSLFLQSLAKSAMEAVECEFTQVNKVMMYCSAFCDPVVRVQLPMICEQTSLFAYDEIVDCVTHTAKSLFPTVDSKLQFDRCLLDFDVYEGPLQIVEEIKIYERLRLESVTEGMNSNTYTPLRFWRCNEYKFPILSKLAKLYLSIPATTAASRRAFHKFQPMVSPIGSLEDKTVSNILCLRSID